MTQHLILNYTSIIVQKDLFYGHCGYFRNKNPSKRISKGGIYTNHVKLYFPALSTNDLYLEIVSKFVEIPRVIVASVGSRVTGVLCVSNCEDIQVNFIPNLVQM